MGICKVPTLQLKVLNKHSVTHIMYIEMEMLSAIKMYIIRKKRKLTDNADKGSSVTMQKPFEGEGGACGQKNTE